VLLARDFKAYILIVLTMLEYMGIFSINGLIVIYFVFTLNPINSGLSIVDKQVNENNIILRANSSGECGCLTPNHL
jgi:hypothetical protein